MGSFHILQSSTNTRKPENLEEIRTSSGTLTIVFDQVVVNRQTGSLVVFWIAIVIICIGSLIVIFSIIVVIRSRMKRKNAIHPLNSEDFQTKQVRI